MSHKRLIQYLVPVVAVAAVLPFPLLLPAGSIGVATLLLAAVMISAWYGGLGPGLLATALSALALNRLRPAFYSPATSWEDAMRLVVFLTAAGIISSLNARQRRLETALRCHDRQKDELLAVLAHELRSPLTAILSAVQVLRVEQPDRSAEAPMADLIERQARNMARLIEDLLDVSRIGLGKLRLCRTRVDMTATVRTAIEVARPLIELHRHLLDSSLPAGPLFLQGDALRLEQVVVNLLSNAARYTQPGGCIWITLESAEGQIVLRVRDTGIGVAPELLPHMFDLYVQAADGSRGGLGIGLNLVRSLVRLHSGEVSVFSAGLGRGTEFVLRFPVAHPDMVEDTGMVPGGGLSDGRIAAGGACPTSRA